MLGWAQYQQRLADEARRLEVCCCGCHGAPMRERPPRMEHSYYCEECNALRFTPLPELLESLT